LIRYRHTMVVGGTGMLSSTSIALARCSRSLTSIARTPRSLAALEQHLADLACRNQTLAQDYHDLAALRSGMRGAISEFGPVDLLLAWIHDETGPVPGALVDVAIESGGRVHMVHVMGSAAAGPTGSLAALAERFDGVPLLRYQQVVLGFQREGAGSRWLSHREISEGVMSAIEDEASPYIVGQVEPWALRP
jgi:hypothetical protein